MITRTLPFGPDAIAEAARLVGAGQTVAVPTETVYGLAADATRGAAVAAIYEAKGRPSFNPLIVHVSELDEALALADLPPAAITVAEKYWPGPLTLVTPLRPGAPIATLATAGLPTIALRVPAHPAMRALLAACGVPLAAPSANRSGRTSPTRAAHVLASLEGRIPLVIDGGACAIGLESTIVALIDGRVRLLRAGPIAADEIAALAGLSIKAAGAGIEAPGQLLHHYAPAKPLRLDATDRRADEWLIGFGPITGDASLSPTGDLTEAAARLFDLLHRADASDRAAIAVAPIPMREIGVALNDRLKRAARR